MTSSLFVIILIHTYRLRVEDEETIEPLAVISADELATYRRDDVIKRIAELDDQVGKMKPNMNAIREFRKKDAEYKVCVV